MVQARCEICVYKLSRSVLFFLVEFALFYKCSLIIITKSIFVLYKQTATKNNINYKRYIGVKLIV